MSSEHTTDGIETTASPAVSSLRSRFERLAADASPSLKPPSTPHLSASPLPLSPRLAPTHVLEHARAPSDISLNVLHPSSSSSDLRAAAAKRPPPPPPPLRAPSPANVGRSPLLRPVPDPAPSTLDHDLHAGSLPTTPKPPSLRRPPPPPPPSSIQEPAAQRLGGVSDLVKQFG